MNDNMTGVTREALKEFGETKRKRFSKWPGYPCPHKRAHLLNDDQRAGVVEASGNVLGNKKLPMERNWFLFIHYFLDSARS